MNPSENDIDQLFAALRDTQPSPGFQQRLLATVEQAREEVPQRRQWWPSLAVAGACAVLLVAHLVQVRHRTPATPAVAHAPALSTPPAVSSTNTAVAASATPPHFALTAQEPTQPKPQVAPATVSSAEQLAQEETSAPSQVAPPMPLTAGERLLLRAARRNTDMNVAQLETFPRPPASRQDAVTEFVQRNLASLAFSEAFRPTPPVEAPPVPAPEAQPATAADVQQ